MSLRRRELEILTTILEEERENKRGGAKRVNLAQSIRTTSTMRSLNWLSFPFSFPTMYGAVHLQYLMEALFVLPLMVAAFFTVVLCTRLIVYHILYLRRPGRGKVHDLSGKLFVITGGTSGIGHQIVRDLFSRNAKVIILIRNLQGGINVRRNLREEFIESTGDITPIYCDLTNLGSVKVAADLILKTFERVDGLVCNAGIGALRNYEMTIDGIEAIIQTNCISHALLASLLTYRIQETKGAIINVSSHVAHDTLPFDYRNPFFEHDEYDGYQAYCRSKLMINLFTEHAAKKFTKDVCFLAIYPGIVYTPIGDQFVRSRVRRPALLPYIMPISRFIFWLVGRTVSQGALTVWPLLVDPSIRPPSGSVIDTRFNVIKGDHLNKAQISTFETEKMRKHINEAVSDVIVKYLKPIVAQAKEMERERLSKSVDFINEMKEDIEVQEEIELVVAEEATTSFSLTRRLSQRKEKIVNSIRAGLVRRRQRRSNSTENDDDVNEKEEEKYSNRAISEASNEERVIYPVIPDVMVDLNDIAPKKKK